MSKTIILPPGIGSYVTVLEPRADQQGKLKYSITVLLPKSRAAELKPLEAAILEVAKEKWGNKAEAIIKAAKYPVIRDGDKKVDADGQPDPVYAGHLYFAAKSDKKPGVIDAMKQPVFTEEDIYSGCFLRISANVFSYEYQGNKGISLGLNNVQVLRKGDRIAGRKAAEAEFSEWKDDKAADPLA